MTFAQYPHDAAVLTGDTLHGYGSQLTDFTEPHSQWCRRVDACPSSARMPHGCPSSALSICVGLVRTQSRSIRPQHDSGLLGAPSGLGILQRRAAAYMTHIPQSEVSPRPTEQRNGGQRVCEHCECQLHFGGLIWGRYLPQTSRTVSIQGGNRESDVASYRPRELHEA